MTKEELMKRTGLSEENAEILKRTEQMLPMMAELAGADLFIDCMDKTDGIMFVAAQAGPKYMPSAYQKSVVGCAAEQKDEPAVYRALETRTPVRDIKAVTQEENMVRQDAVPIQGEDGSVIGILIGERDISKEIRREQKYEAMARQPVAFGSVASRTESTAVRNARREVHHRVKNHLQLIASIMNIQARKSESEEVKQAFRENIARVQSIASINEILTANDEGPAPLMPFLEKLKNQFLLLYGAEYPIDLKLSGDDLTVSQDQATDVALVVNELVSNAYKHAFKGRENGKIRVILKNGERYASVTVQDNGTGTEEIRNEGNFGMMLVQMTVKDKLKGKVYVESGEDGTSVTFDFLIDKSTETGI